MGWYVRRSMKIMPGVRVNFSNRGMGVSVGTRGVHVSTSATGRRTFSAGIPGTGIRYRETLNPKPRKRIAPPAPTPVEQPMVPEVTNLPQGVKTTTLWRSFWWVLVWLFGLGGLGNTLSPQPGQPWWQGPASIAGAVFVGKWLHATRHEHRIPRES